jgi:hypothetical protein
MEKMTPVPSAGGAKGMTVGSKSQLSAHRRQICGPYARLDPEPPATAAHLGNDWIEIGWPCFAAAVVLDSSLLRIRTFTKYRYPILACKSAQIIFPK